MNLTTMIGVTAFVAAFVADEPAERIFVAAGLALIATAVLMVAGCGATS